MFIRMVEDLKRAQDILSLQCRIIYAEYKRRKEELDADIKEMELRENKLDQGQALIKSSEWKMLGNYKKQNEIAILELQRDKENIMRRAEDLYRGKKLLLEMRMEQEAKLHELQAFFLQFFKDKLAKIYEKRMEELDREQFMIAVKVKYGSAKAVELCSLWEGYFKEPCWQPYKVVMEGEDIRK